MIILFLFITKKAGSMGRFDMLLASLKKNMVINILIVVRGLIIKYKQK